MKAIVVHEWGGPEVLKYEDWPDPVAGPGQALIRVEAAGVNMGDANVFRGENPGYKSALPEVPGMDGVGTVIALGEGVTSVKVGERVAMPGPNRGTMAEKVAYPADRLIPVPAGLDPVAASCLLRQGKTAHYVLYEASRFRKGDTVLVHAASGGVGHFLVQLCKLEGLTVIGTASTAEKARFALDCGADHALLYTGFAEQVLELTAGKGVQIVFDSIGRDTVAGNLKCTAARGHLLLYGEDSGPPPPFDLSTGGLKNYGRGSIHLSKHRGFDYHRTRDELVAALDHLFRLVLEGRLKTRIHRKFPLAQASQAFAELLGRRNMGSIQLVP